MTDATAEGGSLRTAKSIAVVSAGLSNPSSTRLLADRLVAAALEQLRRRGAEGSAHVIELRDHAHAITDHLLTGFAPAALAEDLEKVARADALIVATPIFTTSYSGLFKSFVDVLDRSTVEGKPVLLGATAGTPRHSLAIDYAIRPLFTYLRMRPVSTGVFASSSDWGDDADRVAPLQTRVDRAAAELADQLVGAAGPAPAADPYDPETYLGAGGSFEDLLNELPGRG